MSRSAEGGRSHLARELDHAFSLADVLAFGGCLFNEMRRHPRALHEHADELAQISRTIGFPSWKGAGISYQGEALIGLGQLEEGMARIRQGTAVRLARDARCYMSGALGYLAEAEAKAGDPAAGLVTLDDALALGAETEERYCEAELHRLRGELQLMAGDDDGAETSFRRALQVARRQQAKSWELRAALSLARLWRSRGNVGEARELLAPLEAWFVEGWDMPERREARRILRV